MPKTAKTSKTPKPAEKAPARAPKAGRPRKILIDNVVYTDGQQARERLDQDTVNEYAERMREGVEFPPIVVFHDGSLYHIGDGFHRFHAARHLGEKIISAQVMSGTVGDARWYAAGANKSHGLKRGVEDKQKAVGLALALRPNLSDRAIAEHCGVSHTMVSGIRSKVSTGKVCQSDTPRTGLDGRTTNTANIGKTSRSAQREETFDASNDSDEDLDFGDREEATESPAEAFRDEADSEGSDEAAAPGRGAAGRLLDATGQPVPSDIAEKFEEVKLDVLGFLGQMRALGTEIGKSQGRAGWESADFAHIESRVSSICSELRQAVLPHAVCPHCEGFDADRKGCAACSRKGWMVKVQWVAVPSEFKAGRKG